MKEEKSEGIVLRSFDYKERQKIATVFTPEHGLLSLIIKKRPLLACATPLCRAEFVYQRGKSDLFPLQDATALEFHFELRKELSYLQTAGELCQILLRSQLPGAASHRLYALALAYLKHIPSFKDPTPLILSFRLKLLHIEGTLALRHTCSKCTQPASSLQEGESVCATHALDNSLVFSQHEWNTLHFLVETRSFASLRTLVLESCLLNKLSAIDRPIS